MSRHSEVLSRQALLQLLDPLIGLLLAPLFDYYTTFGHGNQRHPGPLSNLDGRERRLVQFPLSERYHPCTYLGAGP